MQHECADVVSQVISQDVGLSDDEAHMLSVAMVGMAQVSARYWLGSRRHIPRPEAAQLVARLAWRGISGWPLSEQPSLEGAPQSSAEGAQQPSL